MYAMTEGGFIEFLIVLAISIYLVNRWKRQEKKAQRSKAKSFQFAQSEFLKNPEAKAYIEDGYEIKKITDEGDGIYHFELSKKVSHS